jgi:phage terminase large subunit
VSIRSGHGVGKTTLEAWLILWFLLNRKNCKVPVAANSQDQLRDTIWPEIGK